MITREVCCLCLCSNICIIEKLTLKWLERGLSVKRKLRCVLKQQKKIRELEVDFICVSYATVCLHPSSQPLHKGKLQVHVPS